MAKKTDTPVADKATDDQAAQQPANENLVPGQQTGGTNDAVTEASVQVEPVKPAAQTEQQAPVVGKAPDVPTEMTYAPKAELEVPKPADLSSLPPFHAFVREHEDKAQERGVVVTGLTHPDAPETNGIYEGRHAGIRVARGPHAVQYSDGSKH